jgi:lysozyme family protein
MYKNGDNYMSTFEEAIPHILKHEGGYVNHVNDTGGATNYGVSLRFLKGIGEIGDFNGDGVVNIEDIKAMTVDDAAEVYRSQWWDKYRYGRINDQTIATKVLDLSVNMGASRAHKLLQMALNKAFGLRLVVDGVIGPNTISVINAIEDDTEQKLLTAYCDCAWGFYQAIIRNNPSQKVFERGWKNRAYALSKANTV